MIKKIKSIIITIILVCIITFMVNNRDSVSIQLFPLPFTIETRLFIVMIGCFVLGLSFGLFFLSRNILKNSITNWQNRRKIKELSSKVDNSDPSI